MKFAILGLPGAGKTTLFDLLTEHVEGPDYSQAANKPRVRAVKVRDARLERLSRDYSPKKTTPASLEILDFPALGGEAGGLADLLRPARETEALLLVLRAFAAAGLPLPDPARDLEEILAEFILADLVVVERRLERLEARSRKPAFTKEDARERQLLEGVRRHLEAEGAVAALELGREERKRLGGFGLLSAKPFVIAVNRGAGEEALDLEGLGPGGGGRTLALDALDELEILRLPVEDRRTFLEEYGISELSGDRLISMAYRAAGRISFFTVGDKEVRAWPLQAGATALEAAREVHTDMARGFIRAEVVSFDDYVGSGGVKGAREKGHLRLEGKDYAVADGDIIEFRFSV